MARALVGVAALALSCGLTSRDFDVAQSFQAGGGPPAFTQSFDSASLLAPLSADVGSVNTITLKAAKLESTDGLDISFVSAVTISVSGNSLPDAVLATLPAQPAAGVTSVELTINPKELKPYLQQGGLVVASISYSPTPVTARGLKLTLTLHGSLL